MKRTVLYTIFLLLSVRLAGQTNNYYRLPINEPLSLSANYGELRGNHFHGGLDIRVGSVPGMPIYAVANGYVSRIVVRPDGYGKAVYITHPNGTVSVYAHLHNFAPAIKTYIENIQYSRQRFIVDESVKEDVLPVKSGDKIGNAGNSGSSNGAHLHFEIRETPLQIPVNVFSRGYYAIPPDTQPPVIRNVAFFSFRQTDNIPCITTLHQQKLPRGKISRTVAVPDTFYVGVDAYDTQDGTWAKLAINSLCVWLDKELVFECQIEDIPFGASLYINSAIAYEEKQRAGSNLLQTYVEPGNKLAIYKTAKNKGLITLPDTLRHHLQITVTDDTGNKTTTSFTVQKKPDISAQSQCRPSPKSLPFYWDRENAITSSGLQITIPQGALYKSIRMEADTLPERPDKAFSPLWRVHTPETPLHRAMSLKINADVPEALQSKALIAGISNKGAVFAIGGRWHNKAVETSTRSFGDFFVTVDTIAPTIKALFAEGANLSKQLQLKIKITDDLSGIASYSAYVDGKWALIEYDSKNNMLIYLFDPKRIAQNERHELLLTVTDHKQNTATLQTHFVW
jgi:hypothetical protein